jgi:YtcA family
MNPGPLILVTKTNRFETALQPFNAISEVRCRMAGPAVGTSQFGFQRFSSVTLRRCLILIEVFFLESCGSSHDQAPSLDVLGSYFPAWLISLAAAVMLTVIARSAGRLMGIRVSGFLGFLLCVSLILIFSISVWFKFFAS